MKTSTIKTIGLAKENESPENPGSLEKRTAMVPEDILKLINSGVKVFFETGTGEGIGFDDKDYEAVGAVKQSTLEIYKNKDMVIKFKGPALEHIPLMNPGTILFCMAHFKSFPDRAALLERHKINVVAMENILETPKYTSDEIILGKSFVKSALKEQSLPLENLNINFIGYNEKLVGGIRRAGNRNTNTLSLYQADIKPEELECFDASSIYFYDSREIGKSSTVSFLSQKPCQLFDLKEYEKSMGDEVIKKYRSTHEPFEFGGRRIQCLHITGQAGARYGFKILKEMSSKNKQGPEASAVVLGYGNVGMGGIHECYDQGVRKIHILGRKNTAADRIEEFLLSADVIINGAEQPAKLRGKNYLIKSEHVKNTLQKGTVIIDLVGGSPTNRSAVEDAPSCTFLTDPHFEKEGVFISALWGWPMLGMMRESALRYSGQIADVLLGDENLIQGIENLSKGVQSALESGPFKV